MKHSICRNNLMMSLDPLSDNSKANSDKQNAIKLLLQQQNFFFDPQLTRSEVKCLVLAAKGKTSGQTAKLLGIKSSTVETHRREIKRKLSCNTIAQAVFEGILFGYITPKLIDR